MMLAILLQHVPDLLYILMFQICKLKLEKSRPHRRSNSSAEKDLWTTCLKATVHEPRQSHMIDTMTIFENYNS